MNENSTTVAELTAQTREWEVWRLDDNANEFKIKVGLTQQQAEQLVAEYQAKGHKQHYWCVPSARSAAS